jgi:hypothetical protein
VQQSGAFQEEHNFSQGNEEEDDRGKRTV